MIKYKVVLLTLHIHYTELEIEQLIHLLLQGRDFTPEEDRMLYSSLISHDLIEHEFEHRQPIKARQAAFKFVYEIENRLMEEGHTDPRRLERAHKANTKTYYFTVFAVWDGVERPIGRPVNTPGIKLYRGKELAYYESHGLDIGNTKPIVEFVPELSKQIQLMPA